LNIPLIVGGGIRSIEQLENAYDSGADMIVIGTAFEENELFFKEMKSPLACGHFPEGENKKSKKN
jgi:putative glycerol-1-phosphate prenyltransferase